MSNTGDMLCKPCHTVIFSFIPIRYSTNASQYLNYNYQWSLCTEIVQETKYCKGCEVRFFFQSRSSCLGDLYTIFDVGTLKLRISTHFRHVHLYRALVMNALSRLVFYGTTVTGKLLILVCP